MQDEQLSETLRMDFNRSVPDALSETLALMTDDGVVLKMVGAGHPDTLHTDTAHRFQLAEHGGLGALVLRWTSIKTRQPVGFIDLADVKEQIFDASRLSIQLWPHGEGLPPLHLVARDGGIAFATFSHQS